VKTGQIFSSFLFSVVVVSNVPSAEANNIDSNQIQMIPNYSISTSEETTGSFQLSTPSQPIPVDNNIEKPSSSKQKTQTITDNSQILLDSLNPNPNPLQYPTKPQEVQIKKIQAITLEQALELSRRNNRELQVGLLELQRAQAAVKESQASLLPNAGFSAEIARQQSAQNQLAVESINIGTDQETTILNGTLQLNYDLYTGGRRHAQIGQAEERLRIQKLAVEVLEEEVRLNVSTEYFDLQQADEEVRIANAAVVRAC